MYELRTYRAAPGRMPDLLRRFRDHTLALFARHGMQSVGYWHPNDDPDVLVYLLRHEHDPETQWKAFLADPDWLAAKAASEVNGPLTLSIDSRYLSLIDDLPTQFYPGGAP